VDDNCDGSTDESSAADASTWYADTDGDGYGSSAVSTVSCSAPSGYIADATDCDDTSASVSPGVTETCNGVDDNCDGSTDESSAVDASTWYADADGDGYGNPAVSTVSCSAPSGYTADATDCDDTSASVSPVGTETCNGVDDNCDGSTDESSAADASTWYLDSDGDGYGSSAVSTVSCSAPSGYTANNTDCDDTSASVNPGVTETCSGVDDNCDGVTDSGPGMLDIMVDGTPSNFYVCVVCEVGEYSCQAEQLCSRVTGETCVYQAYNCDLADSGGSWYPPSTGGSYFFNFAYSFEMLSGGYGNICDHGGYARGYGIATRYLGGLRGRWYRQ
jgi:hypothetical protein